MRRRICFEALSGIPEIQPGDDLAALIVAALEAVHAQGVTVIRGDIVLDQSAFQIPRTDPAAFDGERLRPYNAAPDALLLNYKAVAMGFTPDTAAGVAHVRYEPPLARLQLPTSVPLAPAGTACGDWRMGLQAELTHAERIAFQGAYPAACGAREWSVAPSDPSGYAARAVEGMWRELGGRDRKSVV